MRVDLDRRIGRYRRRDTARLAASAGRAGVATPSAPLALAVRGGAAVLAGWLLLAGCSTPEERPTGVEKSVVGVKGVAHGPVLVTADEVAPGGTLRGWAEGQDGRVLVQAMLERSQRPIGQAVTGPLGGRTEFAFEIPEGAVGTILVRAIDRKGIFTDKTVEIVASDSR